MSQKMGQLKWHSNTLCTKSTKTKSYCRKPLWFMTFSMSPKTIHSTPAKRVNPIYHLYQMPKHFRHYKENRNKMRENYIYLLYLPCALWVLMENLFSSLPCTLNFRWCGAVKPFRWCLHFALYLIIGPCAYVTGCIIGSCACVCVYLGVYSVRSSKDGSDSNFRSIGSITWRSYKFNM